MRKKASEHLKSVAVLASAHRNEPDVLNELYLRMCNLGFRGLAAARVEYYSEFRKKFHLSSSE